MKQREDPEWRPIRWAAIAAALLVVPGAVIGGIYLVPATLIGLGIEVSGRASPAATR